MIYDFSTQKRNKGKKELAPMHLRFLQFFTALRKRQFCSPVLYSLSLAFRHCFVRLFEAASAASSHSLAMFLYCDFKFIQHFFERRNLKCIDAKYVSLYTFLKFKIMPSILLLRLLSIAIQFESSTK